MAVTDNNTIGIKVSYPSPYMELITTAVVGAGYLLERVTDENTCRPHSTSGGPAAPLFVIENAFYHGKGIEDTYEIGERVMARYFRPGDFVISQIVPELTIVVGDLLASAGNGALKKFDNIADSVGSIVGTALHDVTSTTLHEWIKIEVR